MDGISIKKAAIINASGKYATVIVQILVNAILSRLLTPDDYGIVALITVFSTFFIMLSDMGFSTAIVQNKELSKEDLNKIFSFTLIIAIILMASFCGFSIIISRFYSDSVYFKTGPILSISLFFNALNMVPNGIMNKNKRFVSIAIRTVVACIVAADIAICLAFLGWRYYAIVIQSVVSAIIIFIWNLAEVKIKFDFCECIQSVKKILNYSSYQFAFNLVNYFSRNLDNLLTGKFFGKAELGYYNKAYTLMLYPVNNLAGVVTPVIHPLLSDYQNQKEHIYKQYVKIVRLLFVVAGFIAPFCFLCADEIVTILFGTQWKESVICFRFLSLAMLPQFIGAPTGAIYQSIGKTKLLFYNAIINTAITVIGIVIGVFWGHNIKLLSMCVALAYVLHFFTTNYVLIHIGFKRKLVNFILEMKKEIFILVFVVVGVVTCQLRFDNRFISCIAKGVYLIIFWFLGLFLTGVYKDLIAVFIRRR